MAFTAAPWYGPADPTVARGRIIRVPSPVMAVRGVRRRGPAAAKKCVECGGEARFGLHKDRKVRWCFGCAKGINCRNSALEGDFKPAAVMLVKGPGWARGRPKGSETKKKVVVKASYKSAAGKAKGPIGKAGKTKQVCRPNEPKPRRLKNGVPCQSAEERWQMQCGQLRAFKEEHGHCNVHKLGWPDAPALGNWVANQRAAKKRLDSGEPARGLTAERMAVLDEMGFEWARGTTGSNRSHGAVRAGDNWKGSKAALVKWTCPHCSCARLSVMPWVAARWEVAGCGTVCSRRPKQEVDKEKVNGQKLTEKDDTDEEKKEKKDEEEEVEPPRRSSRRR